MPSLKDLRVRIGSVKATRKITKAMQMVAAAKLRRAQEAAIAARPYAERLDRMLANLAGRVAGRENASPLLVGTGKQDVQLMIVTTAERGLAGAFNGNIVKLVREDARRHLREGRTVKLMIAGKKGGDALRREYSRNVGETIDMRAHKTANYTQAKDIADRVIAMYEAGEFDVATLYFSEFQNILTQKPKALQLIPAQLPVASVADTGVAQADTEFEPDEDEILAELLPRNIATQVFRALLENAAGEQGARMTAMDNATRNAGDMIDDLTLIYNRRRQANITRELIEIISGAEAL